MHISISSLWGYPYLIGLHYEGVYVFDIPIHIFAYVLFGALKTGVFEN